MPNINKIKLGDTEYDIEDGQARIDANAAMKAAADALDKIAVIESGGSGPGAGGAGAPLGSYGVRWYKTQSLTALDRILDSVGKSFSPSVGAAAGRSDFDNIYPWSEIKKSVVVNGAPAYYKGEAGFSLSPAIGDVMDEIPAYYYKVEDSALFRDYIIASNKPGVDPKPDGFLLSPRHMPTPGKPEGWDKIYTSTYSLNSAYRSISGSTSLVSISRTTARAGCRNRGPQYHLDDFATFWTRNLLYLVETADWNSQLAVGPGYTDAGNTAQIATGGADAVAWHSGRASGNSVAAKNAVKYRGMENLWGNLWTWCDGINFNGNTVYINLNPATYADDAAAGNALSYSKAAANGFQKVLGFDPNFPFAQIPTDTTGADGTFVSDYYWQNTGWRALLLGGVWLSAGYAGLFAFASNDAASSVGTVIGARLLVLP